jgi:branched-chain amino acid transport system substrate-binding protein
LRRIRSDIVFGPLSGDEGVAIANYSKKVPSVTFVNTASSASETTIPGEVTRTSSASTVMQLSGQVALAKSLTRLLATSKVAIIADDYSFPYANAGGFATGFCKAGGTDCWSTMASTWYKGLLIYRSQLFLRISTLFTLVLAEQMQFSS